MIVVVVFMLPGGVVVAPIACLLRRGEKPAAIVGVVLDVSCGHHLHRSAVLSMRKEVG